MPYGVAITASLGLCLSRCAAPAPEQPTLVVSVAVSFAPALKDAAELYRQRRPDLGMEVNAAASGVLLQQARRGARSDVFISASGTEIDRLVEWNLADASTRRLLASNRLVIVVPSGSDPPTDERELAAARFRRIAVGNPRTAPLGRYTEQALEALDLREAAASRLVLAENARQALDYIARGEVDEAVVYRTDARLVAGRLVVGPEIPSDLHAPIEYEGVVLLDATAPDAAREFLDWLAAPSGRAPLLQHGFLSP